MSSTTKELFERRKSRNRLAVKKRNSNRPRLSVFRSSKHIYVQVIDDLVGKTVVSASSVEQEVKSTLSEKGLSNGATVTAAEIVGHLIGARAKSAGVNEVVFDRSGYRYHGRVKALADAARGEGLNF